MFLSAAPLTRRVLSEEMSIDSTGSLWPYRDRKNLRVSVKKTLMVESSRDTANSLPACAKESRVYTGREGTSMGEDSGDDFDSQI